MGFKIGFVRPTYTTRKSMQMDRWWEVIRCSGRVDRTGCGPTSLIACHLRALSWLMSPSATLMKCWLSSSASARLRLPSATAATGTSAAAASSCTRDSMSVGSRSSRSVSSSACLATSSRAEASPRSSA